MRDHRNLLSEVRLWDWRALDAVYKQFQEIRLYYEFVDVDIDRYTIGDRYRQVMVSARELAPENLPSQSQTFVNRRFKYTHGYGYTRAPVSDFTPQGLPNLLVRDIPPKAEYESLAVTRPEIYYGELTDQPVIVPGAGIRLSPRRHQRVHPLPGPGRRAAVELLAQADLRLEVRRHAAAAVELSHHREPHHRPSTKPWRACTRIARPRAGADR